MTAYVINSRALLSNSWFLLWARREATRQYECMQLCRGMLSETGWWFCAKCSLNEIKRPVFLIKPIVNQQSSFLFVSIALAWLHVFLCQSIQIAQLHRFMQQNNETSAQQLQENATSFMVHPACRTIRLDYCFILVQQVKHTNCPICRRSQNFDKETSSVWPRFAYSPGMLS